MIKRCIKFFTYFLFLLAFFIGCTLAILYSLGPPPLTEEAEVTILASNGEPLTNTKKNLPSLEALPDYALEGFLLAEDKHFYAHYGFDPKGIARALVRNLQAGKLKEGASTITQQLARNLYLSHEKTWSRKIKELYYTLRLEMFYEKDEILLAYLNTIYFGHGAYGIEEASYYYYQKSARDLSLAEATMLVGIPKGPTYYSPFNDRERAEKRQAFILSLLKNEGVITEAAYYEALKEKPALANNKTNPDDNVHYFIDYVWQEAVQELGFEKQSLQKRGATIETTLDQDLQRESDELIRQEVEDKDELEVALLALDQTTGAIRQMLGGKNYQASPFNRAVDGKRMVGSTFKPLLYYAALENGFTATTMLQSEPTAFLVDNDVYEPSNYNDYYAYKPISLAQAIALSDNIYAVKTHLFLGAENVVDWAKKFGISTPLPEVASLALGSASIPLIEMVQAYATIANGGFHIEPYAIERIVDGKGHILYEREEVEKERILKEKKAFLLTHLMTGMFDRRLNGYMEVTGASLIDQLQPEHEFAGKSGSTSADSWMIGYSPKLVAGVWTGYDDNRPLTKTSERALAKKAWASLMHTYHAKEEESLRFEPPEGLVEAVIDVHSGLLATEACETTRKTYFEEGTAPTLYCTDHLANLEDEDQRIETASKKLDKEAVLAKKQRKTRE